VCSKRNKRSKGEYRAAELSAQKKEDAASSATRQQVIHDSPGLKKEEIRDLARGRRRETSLRWLRRPGPAPLDCGGGLRLDSRKGRGGQKVL